LKVRSVLEKLPADTICLDPRSIGAHRSFVESSSLKTSEEVAENAEKLKIEVKMKRRSKLNLGSKNTLDRDLAEFNPHSRRVKKIKINTFQVKNNFYEHKWYDVH
jgi:hypothetical protein